MKKSEFNMKKFLIFKLSSILIFILFFSNCYKDIKKGNFEKILDEYISINKIDKTEHYLLVSSNKWTDSTSIIVLEYNYFKKDKLKLPENSLRSSYQGITMYFFGNIEFPAPNGFLYEKIKTEQENKLESYNEYFNEVQIEYFVSKDCFIDIINYSKASESLRKTLKKNGLLCK